MSVVVQAALLEASELVGLKFSVDFNVVKIGRGKTVVSLLDYANFFDDAFPRLEKVCTVNLAEKRSSVRTYQPDANPPILHRKELLLRFDHPSRPLFEKLTRDLDGRGIKPDKPRLGFQNQWDEYLAEMGVAIHNHKFAELANGHD